MCEFEVEVEVEVHSLHLAHLLTSFVKSYTFHIYFDMVCNFPTNADFDSWVSSSKPTRIVKQYVNWISDYADHCLKESLNIHDGQYVESFLVYRHKTPKVAKRSNQSQKVKKGEDKDWRAVLHPFGFEALFCFEAYFLLCSTWSILLWSIMMFSYLKGRQDGRPERMKSMLGEWWDLQYCLYPLYR